MYQGNFLTGPSSPYFRGIEMAEEFTCGKCGKTFQSKKELEEHVKKEHMPKK